MRSNGRAVDRDGDRILFLGKVGSGAHREFMWCLHDAQARGYRQIVLDFTACTSGYLDGMIAVIAHVDALRRNGVEIWVDMPSSPRVDRWFRKSNWAHFLQPDRFEPADTVHERLAARRFASSDEQQAVVDDYLDVVMRNMTLERDVIAGLEWSINEITDNVLNHAECSEGGIAQVQTFTRNVAFVVADAGRGVLASLREGHPELRTDDQAIGEAMKAGVTRDPDAGQGNGIAGAMRIAMMSEGFFEITSGLAQIAARTEPDGTEPEAAVYKREESQRFPGTLVHAQVGLHGTFHLAEALGFSGGAHQPTDVIELHYETEDGGAVAMRLKDESTGFGSRAAGRELRTKCMNLLNAEREKPLLLDWAGVPLVSSSFADELVGKLFVSLGPLTFAARVRNVGMEATVRGLVEKAIMERVAQTGSVRR